MHTGNCKTLLKEVKEPSKWKETPTRRSEDFILLRPTHSEHFCQNPSGLFCLFFFFYFRAAPVAYANSQATGWIRAAPTGLHHSHSKAGSTRATSPTYTTAHSNTRSLTHWARPGIESASSWILVKFITTEPQQELPSWLFYRNW